MNGCLVAQRNNSEHTALKLWNDAPESKAVMFLRLNLERIFYHADAPLLFQVWPLSQNFLLKIFGVLIFSHIYVFILYLILSNN